MAETVQIEIIKSDLGQKFHQLMMQDGTFRQEAMKTIKQQISKARNKTVRDMKQYVGAGYPNSQGDPRQAFRAVKYSAYRNVMGGSISLYNKRRASQQRVELKRKRKLDQNPHQRGGNRIEIDKKSKASALGAYWGSDRAFILRFLNVGTSARESRHGNRGVIRGRDYFSRITVWHMTEAAEEIEKQIAEAIEQIWKE